MPFQKQKELCSSCLQVFHLMSIEDVMNTGIFDIPYEGSIFDAVRTLHEKRVGSVVVIKDKKPYGIFTEWDAVASSVGWMFLRKERSTI